MFAIAGTAATFKAATKQMRRIFKEQKAFVPDTLWLIQKRIFQHTLR